MAWDVDQIKRFLQYQARSNQAGTIKPDDFMFAWNQEQSAYQSDLIGRWERESNGKTGPETGLIENEAILTKLSPFTQMSVGVTVTGGSAPKPADFVYALALRETTSQKKIFQVNHDQIWFLSEDVIDPPSVTDNSYYYTEVDGAYSIYPNTVTSIDLDYIQEATDIVWGFTVLGNGQLQYNALSSTQPQWGQNSIIDITKRCMKSLGISFKDQDFTEFGNSNQKTGD